MKDFMASMSASSSGMQAQASRLRVLSENLANADTPGYRRKTISFVNEYNAFSQHGRVKAGPIDFDQRELARIHDPSHPLADAGGYYDGSNVDMVVEIADAREAQRSYEANLKLFDQARKMTSSLLELLRR